MDTQRLVNHAFMSRKIGLRAKHLGLHRAICVLLGWDTVVPHDTITWVPHVLPDAEALAQKEDLILWPPLVIIHNISMSDNNPKNWKVITMETIEAVLRERLHKYFFDSHRGRADFEQVNSDNNKCSISEEPSIQGDMVESILYGYMGIAEDLDKVDFNTRMRILIKSKREIEDLEMLLSNLMKGNN
ncbi:putative Suppressor of gene silencing protein [Quillaja saponaria]|uniref:Suppressor of gene silencing protein n=1 Tax=Quillaja saponaria TaxID=32244 RepID=A0AAD7KMK5_QUISA|nr:putative Suppressor of gene silencing protein [Quillaja saponaria]